MNGTISNYAQVKENTGWHLAMDHICSVLVHCSRKWDRDSKQIQIACYCFRACGWPALQTEYSNRFWFSGPRKGDDPPGNIWGTRLSVKKYNIKICPATALGWKIIKVEFTLCQTDTWQENQTAHTHTQTHTNWQNQMATPRLLSVSFYTKIHTVPTAPLCMSTYTCPNSILLI